MRGRVDIQAEFSIRRGELTIRRSITEQGGKQSWRRAKRVAFSITSAGGISYLIPIHLGFPVKLKQFSALAFLWDFVISLFHPFFLVLLFSVIFFWILIIVILTSFLLIWLRHEKIYFVFNLKKNFLIKENFPSTPRCVFTA